MSTPITLDQVRKTLAEVVADFGRDTKYAQRYEEITGETYDPWDGCQYQVGGTPACVAGVVLHRLGIALDPEWDADAMTVNEISVAIEPNARDYLLVAQQKQDSNFTWGYAHDEAEASL